MEPLSSRRGGINRAISVVTRSNITSPTRHWVPWMHCSMRLKMSLFMSLLWNRKTMPWCWCPPMGQMSGWVITISVIFMGHISASSNPIMCTTTTRTEIQLAHKTHAVKYLLHMRRHGPQGTGNIVFLPFCWLYQMSTIIWGGTTLVAWRTLGQCWSSGDSFLGTSSITPTSGKMRVYQKHARAREKSTPMDTLFLYYLQRGGTNNKQIVRSKSKWPFN